ncbi:MAG: peptide ABC transporter substrate-binding protein [Anaerolineae bacterium]|nr:peptide ABC transporter substrate-binding protein [Anaerolineae bacterium]MDW8098893.1 peptide ABC transporter substrate-binding protein [Anaerolineae bacterium]
MSAKQTWFTVLGVLVVMGMLVAACAPQPAPTPVPPTEQPPVAEVATPTPAPKPEEPTPTPVPIPEEAYTTIYGERLPEDAAPYDWQIYKVPCDIKGNHITFDFQVAVYQRFCLSDLFQDQLVNLDKDFNVIPASAERWEVSEDGLTWTFYIKPGLQWSDGTPLTAYDWEATYQMIADPKHAWDFAWFYSGVLKNWDEIIAGELPPTELGVKALDDLTLQITTQTPWPPLPAMMQFSFVMQKKALEQHGPLYNSKVETSVSAGPFKLEVLEPGKRIELVANPMYKGFRKPRLKRLIAEYMDMSTAFIAFQNHEIDQVGYEWLTPADFAIIQSDPVLKANYLRHYGDFRTDYLLFDTYNPPFNDLNVRKAFAHAVDRESIVKNVYGEIKAMPAYSFLMPGFPASDTEGKLKEYQKYDCELARDYLAKAGYPNGQGFPKLEMWLRSEGPAMQAVFQAVAASISECLNIQIEVSNKDFKVYMDALNAKPTQLQFGAVSYGMDFLDPSNMLGIWLSTGRHSWKNDEFDRLVREASSLTGDPERRKAMFQEAERILVDDVGGIFIAHRWQGDLFQPYIQGDGIREPDSQGIAAWHWGNDWVWGNIYISKDVMNYTTYRNQLLGQ